MQRCPGGALWQAQSNQRCSHPRGMSAAISPRHPRLLWAGGALGPTRERAAMQPCRVEHWDAGALGRWGTAEAFQEGSTGGPTLHRVVALLLLHAAHLPLRDDIEGVACGATVRGTHGTPEANTRRAHAYHARGPGASCPAPPVRTARRRLARAPRTCQLRALPCQPCFMNTVPSLKS